MRRIPILLCLAVVAIIAIALSSDYFSPVSQAQNRGRAKKIDDDKPGKRMAPDKAAVQRIKEKTNGNSQLNESQSTGAVNFIGFGKTKKGELSNMGRGVSAREKGEAFLAENDGLFGVKNSGGELRFESEKTDSIGSTHQTYAQFYNGVPVFAGVMKTHVDSEGELYAVNGNPVPEIEVDTNPSVSADSVSAAAVDEIAAQTGFTNLTARSNGMYVYRTGLAQGVPGNDYLAYEIEVTGGDGVRELLYMDAHSGKIVDQITGNQDALDRRAYDGAGKTLAQIMATVYPANTFWVEGQAFPTANAEANNMITSSKETYDFFYTAFGRDSFDGAGKKMDSIFNRGYGCPNASWNSTFISFCSGLTVDDVTAHEWGHAYTEYTHGLIYQWQPGALNEAYSDMWGETVDRINGRDNVGNSATDPARTEACSIYTPGVVRVVVNSPAAIAGTYPAQPAAFGPPLTAAGLTGNLVQALDGVGTTTDGCTAFTNAAAVAGKIAMIDSTTCAFALKVKNAQLAGATGAIVYRTAANPSGLPGMGGTDATITIPSVGFTFGDGAKLLNQMASSTVNVTLRSIPGSDASTRWLLGEDATGGITGALRDMYNPTCYTNPGKVSDTAYYSCAATDQGGVHTNSGVPNHAYALLVDGGTYNGQTINAIGLTKAAHIYFRAMTQYQVRNTDFKDHSYALIQAATDLIGVNLKDLSTGALSGQMVTADDVAQIDKAIIAVELRTPPTQCNFTPLLAKNPPADPSCGIGTVKKTALANDFEGSTDGWTVSRSATSATFTPRDWSVVGNLPDQVPGSAFYAPDPVSSCDAGAPDETGVISLTSPAFKLHVDTIANQTVTFDHWVATENRFDGGQLMISVNGGAFTLVPTANFTYNAPARTFNATASNTNPRRGQLSWNGFDVGSVDGSWGKTVVNLTGLATAGDTVQLRWDMSSDSCGGLFGWYVDNVNVFACLLDADNDGVPNSDDACAGTDTSKTTIVIGSSQHAQTGVPNAVLSSGCALQQMIDAAKAGAKKHGDYVNAVDLMTSQWVAQGIITDAQKGAIMRAVAKDK